MKLVSATAAVAALLLSAPAMAASGSAWIASNHVRVIDLASGQVEGTIDLGEKVLDIEFTADGGEAFVGASNGLHVYDADSLERRTTLGDTPALSVALAGDRVWGLFAPEGEAARAIRRAGGEPNRQVRAYDVRSGELLVSVDVATRAHRVEVAPDGQSVYVLDIDERELEVYDRAGSLRETIPLMQDAAEGSYILTDMELSPDGSRMAVSISGARAAYIADVDLAGAREDRVWLQDLGNAYRVRGVTFSSDSASVYIPALDSVVKYNGYGLPVSWQGYPQLFTSVSRVPQSNEVVMLAPLFAQHEGGGLVVADADGLMLKQVVFEDMSPTTIAVRPSR